MSIMPIEHVADWEKRIARQDAHWHGAILDRPVVILAVAKKTPVVPAPAPRTYATMRDQWMDGDRLVEEATASALNTEWFGDALPTVWPNLGPEVFPAFFGQDLEFGPVTSWSIPALHDWNDVGKMRFTRDNVYYKKVMELTKTLLAGGKGKYYTGMTDYHPGGDCIAAWRDPQNFAIDMIENVDQVKKALSYIDQVYFEVYNDFYNLLKSHNQAFTNWAGHLSTKKWYVPSNDFSCMISKAMYDDVFLPGITAECKFYQASIYHLDGPGALQHLDSLLEIKELSAVQWIWGAGRGRASDWLHVYKKVQSAGKGLQIWAQPDEIDTLVENLRPEGVWLGVHPVKTTEHAEAIVKKISSWT